VEKKALISACGLYRYWLTRHWDRRLPIVIYIMLNPSIADADHDDPTLRRCIGFARDQGFGGLKIVNLFAWRSPNVDSLWDEAKDVIGPENDRILHETLDAAANNNTRVVAAWGANGDHKGRAAFVKKKANALGLELNCLGQTQSGHPRHPLYVQAAQRFTELACLFCLTPPCAGDCRAVLHKL
jgi:hypothetical protein